jgi:phosphoglucomutase
VTGRDPGQLYADLTAEFGDPAYERIDSPATPQQKAILSRLTAAQVTDTELAGEKITSVITTAPGSANPIGGVKVSTESSWFAVRPSGTEDVYKLYAESFKGTEHLKTVQSEASAIIQRAFNNAR